jgi:hypothetical protein
MSLTKLSLAGNNLIFPGQGEFGKRHPDWAELGTGKLLTFFTMYSVAHVVTKPARTFQIFYSCRMVPSTSINLRKKLKYPENRNFRPLLDDKKLYIDERINEPNKNKIKYL